MSKNDGANLVILSDGDADEILAHAYRLFNVVSDLLYRRRLVLKSPAGSEPAKVVPMRRPRVEHRANLEEIF